MKERGLTYVVYDNIMLFAYFRFVHSKLVNYECF